MPTFLLVSTLLLWPAVLFLGFLLLGSLRGLDLLRWRLDQLEATTPSRIGRSGLKPGKRAPDFTLPSVAGAEVALSEFAGRQVFLVFVQTGCGPCHAVVPDLNRLHRSGDVRVLAINNADPEAGRKWAAEAGAEFPVLLQEKWKTSKRYEVFATPFAFLIDEHGVVASKGIVNSKQHIGFVLDRRRDGDKAEHVEADTNGTDGRESEEPNSISVAKEVGND